MSFESVGLHVLHTKDSREDVKCVWHCVLHVLFFYRQVAFTYTHMPHTHTHTHMPHTRTHTHMPHSILQLAVEEVQVDVVQRRCKVVEGEVEALTVALKAAIKTLQELRGGQS